MAACIYVYAFPDGYINTCPVYIYICLWLKLNPASEDIQNKEQKAWKKLCLNGLPRVIPTA